MAYIKSKYPWGGSVGVLLSALLIFGCAANETVKKDSPFEKWATMAETSTGQSPAPRDRSTSIAQGLLKETGEAGEELKAIPIRELPMQPISLKMRQADVKAILRSLARVVDKNILVKNEIKGEMTVDFNNIPWNQAFNSILRTQGLTYLWEGDIIRVITLDDLEQDLKRKEQDLKRTTQEQGVRQVAALLTVVVPIDYAKPKDLKDNLESFLTRTKEDKPRGSVRVDEYSNSLIISAIKEDILKMMSIIEKIDKPTPQIQIKANIVETTKETARQLGIQWGGMYARRIGTENLYVNPGGSSGSATPPGSALAGTYTPTYPPAIGTTGTGTGGTGTGGSGISGQGFGVNFPIAGAALAAAGGAASLGLMIGNIGGNILDVQLQALQKDSKLNILSSPSITTRDNQMAFTENGERIPYITNQSSGGTITQTTMFEDVVLRLEITPHVVGDQTLSMKILIKKDEVDPVRNVQGNPYIIKKKTETNLMVRDGETIVISGLTKQRTSGGDTGVPGLKDIPILGWLFKSDDRSQMMEEVLIFITPKILPAAIAAVKPAEGKQPAGTDTGGKASAEKAPKP
jgi:type IV pilus assembly protein PilQ